LHEDLVEGRRAGDAIERGMFCNDFSR